MKLVQYRTDGCLDVTDLSLTDVAGAKVTALSLVAYPVASGIYRVQFVDAEYDRICWDSYSLHAELVVGALVYAGSA